MSKLNRQLHLTDAGQRQPMPAPLSCVEVTDTWSPIGTIGYGVYKLTATFVATVTYDKTRKHGINLTEAVRCARRAIVGDVFGEFRRNFDALYAALARHDYETLHAELSKFEAQMFDTTQEETDE